LPVVDAGPPVVLVGWPAGGFTPVPMVLPPVAGLPGVAGGVAAGRVVVAAGGRPACDHRAARAPENSTKRRRIFTVDYRFFSEKA